MRVRALRSIRRSLLGISLCLALAAPEALAAGTAFPEGADPATVPAARPAAPGAVLLASAAKTGNKTAPKKRRSRRRYRQPALTLPEVTPHGIPRLHAKAAYVVDATNHRVLFQKNPERPFPIASLTKLMTALVFFQTQPEFDRYVTITAQDKRHSSRSHIRAGEEISVRDLIHAALMSSDNVATKALVRTCGVPYDEFIARMNAMADSLGLDGAHFVEPTGLDERNVATASDCAKLLQLASTNPIVSAVMQKASYDFTSNRRRHQLVNTNRLLRSKWRVTAGKTGFIHEAGYCLATNVETAAGTEITAVLLGAPSNTMRFAEARRLLDWSYRFGLALSDNPGDD
jgi:D-alanyl-D-alanine endopeptidase (penicillin-binding protein 7)